MPTKTGEGNGGNSEGEECEGENARACGQKDGRDEQARKKKGDEEEKGGVVCDKMNVEGDKTMEETREKRKRGDSEDNDVMKRGKSSLSGEVSAVETMKILRKLEREEWKRKRDDGGAQDVDDVEDEWGKRVGIHG